MIQSLNEDDRFLVFFRILKFLEKIFFFEKEEVKGVSLRQEGASCDNKQRPRVTREQI